MESHVFPSISSLRFAVYTISPPPGTHCPTLALAPSPAGAG